MSAETKTSVFGLMVEFKDHHELLEATERAYAEGYRRMDAYSPFPVEGLAEALGRKGTSVPLVVLLGGMFGGLGGYFMQWFAMAFDYRINVGGRPFHSWPAFIPITFELTVLCASLSAILSMLVFNKLPEPYHPVFNVPEFEQASQTRFFLCIEARDPKFNPQKTRTFLQRLSPKVMEVPE